MDKGVSEVGAPSVPWWMTCYRGIWAEALHNHWSHGAGRRWLGKVLPLMGLNTPGRILDAPCGEGSLALELAAKGHQVVALDISRDFLERGRSKAKRRGLRVDFIEGDMRALPAPIPFDGILCANGSFGYFDDPGNAAFTKAALRALAPGGRLFIEGWVLESLPWMEPETSATFGEISLHETRSFDPVSSRLEVQMRLRKPGGREETSYMSQRVYGLEELRAMLHRTGFECVRVFGSLDGAPFVETSLYAIIVAHAPGGGHGSLRFESDPAFIQDRKATQDLHSSDPGG